MGLRDHDDDDDDDDDTLFPTCVVYRLQNNVPLYNNNNMTIHHSNEATTRTTFTTTPSLSLVLRLLLLSSSMVWMVQAAANPPSTTDTPPSLSSLLLSWKSSSSTFPITATTMHRNSSHDGVALQRMACGRPCVTSSGRTTAAAAAVIPRGGGGSSSDETVLPDNNSSSNDVAENEKLDEYIEQLISTVDNGNNDDVDITDDDETQNVVVAVPHDSDNEENEDNVSSDADTSHVVVVVDENAVGTDTDEPFMVPATTGTDASPVDHGPNVVVNNNSKNNDDDNHDHETEATGAVTTIHFPQNDTAPLSHSSDDNDNADIRNNINNNHDTPDHVPEKTPVVDDVVIPNAVYRFLLGRGRMGHVLIMMCIWIAEFIQTYIPPLATLLGVLTARLGLGEDRRAANMIHSNSGNSIRRRRGGPMVNAQYAGFVSADGTTGRTKQKKKQARLADQYAMEKLRRIGNVREAKYRHVSLDFMKRHHIGSYRDSEGPVVMSAHPVPLNKEDLAVAHRDGVDDEESDIDWVVEALTKQDNPVDEAEEPMSPVETTVSLGMGTEGPSVTVGVEFGIGKRRKKQRRTALDAVTEVSAKKKVRTVGPRASDRDGGGGVMGRIRAAGANSLVSRSLLGAYPGDAVPPSEAASSDGVIALAEKYGYGEWSDSDDEGEYDDNEVLFAPTHVRTKRTRRSNKTRKTRKKSSSFTIGFDISPTSSSTESSTSRRSHGASRRDRSSLSSSSAKTSQSKPLVESSDILGDRATSRRREVRVRAPMERLNEARARSKKDDDN